MKFFLIARFLSRNNSIFPFFFILFKKKRAWIFNFFKIFWYKFFLFAKKKKTVKCNEKYWKYFLTKLDLLKPLKSSKLESCQWKTFFLRFDRTKISKLLRKDKIKKKTEQRLLQKKFFLMMRIVRLNYPKFRYWKNYKFKNVIKNNILVESNDYSDLIKFELNPSNLEKNFKIIYNTKKAYSENLKNFKIF